MKALFTINLFKERQIKFAHQRRTKGWDDSETWSLDYTISKFILPRLKRFRELEFGHPCSITEQEWYNIQDELIWTFQFLSNEEFSYDKKLNKRADKGLRLFAKWYRNLWW
jgi:hypothetical protein